jgi:KDO2-lipid IV(A) lauroyltransferase
MSNFDLAAQWIAAQGFEIQGLSLPNPDAGGRILNRMRAKRGIQMTPISLTSLRAGVKRLNRGGICMTGVDRPTSDRDPLTPFFDRPAHMPTGHVKLALRSQARIQVACCLQREEGTYEIRFPDALEMSQTDDWDRDVRDNVASVLRVVERMILMRPSQWLMFVPVWRDGVGSDLETTE